LRKIINYLIFERLPDSPGKAQDEEEYLVPNHNQDDEEYLLRQRPNKYHKSSGRANDEKGEEEPRWKALQ
jgi:hypothetical protein